MADVIDYEDPCECAAALRKAKIELLAGKRAVQVNFSTGNNVTQSVTFQQTKMDELNSALREFESACAAKGAEKPKRFAIGSGYRPRWPWRV